MNAPPRIVELLLDGLGASGELRQDILGDLAEEFVQRAEQHGVAAARRWYVGEAIRTTPCLVRDWMRGLRIVDARQLAQVLLASYFFSMVLTVLVMMMGRGVMQTLGLHSPFPAPTPGSPMAAPLGLLLVVPVAAMGGYIAASLDKRAPLVAAVALGVVWGCVSVALSTIGPGVPTWYRLCTPLLLIVSTASGGIARVVISQGRGGVVRVASSSPR